VKFTFEEAAKIPPAYRKPLYMLGDIQKNNDLQIIPFETLFFVFDGFQLSHAKTKSVIIELEKIGVFKVIPGVGVRLLLDRENDC
jgi:hypothetical protein